jgi:hypothetical protein
MFFFKYPLLFQKKILTLQPVSVYSINLYMLNGLIFRKKSHGFSKQKSVVSLNIVSTCRNQFNF